jgi:hypothetical protein
VEKTARGFVTFIRWWQSENPNNND